MPILSTDIKLRLSGGASNADPAASLGGAMSSVDLADALFDPVSGDEAVAGDTEYRCVYVYNAHATLTMVNAVMWIVTNTTGARIALGLGTAAVGATEQTVANENTAPTGVTFWQPGVKNAGFNLGHIPPGQGKSVWVRRTIPAGAAASTDNYSLRVECDSAA